MISINVLKIKVTGIAFAFRLISVSVTTKLDNH